MLVPCHKTTAVDVEQDGVFFSAVFNTIGVKEASLGLRIFHVLFNDEVDVLKTS